MTKIVFKEFRIWAFGAQTVGPGWVKNGKKGCFHISHFTTNPVFPKTKFLTAIVS